MGIKEIILNDDPQKNIAQLLIDLHVKGPDSAIILESLSYYKLFHPEVFSLYEEKILSALGLFYKIPKPTNIYSLLMSGIGEDHNKKFGSYLTPVQASIRRGVNGHQFSSISAPTSAGKSYSIRDYIYESEGDAVIIVPSRALIAEYVNSMQRKFGGAKSVMICSFVDKIFTSRLMRRIFVLTPERAKDLFSFKDELNIKTFFFDEAQVSEEKERGVIFDVMVRRIRRDFSGAKLIFAHPFVENPEAQFIKHNIDIENGFYKSYTQGAVGKICLFQHSNGKYYYFSPFQEKSHLLNNCVEFKGSFKDFAFSKDHSVLVYVSKRSIYRGTFADEFKDYISSLPTVTDIEAMKIIDSIEYLVGADQHSHHSEMINLLKKGVVIHHGSVPLEVRFLVEDFIRKGFSSLCFATSTLAQGVNMPFDIVWLDNSRFNGDESERALAFKNLIGRAGRLSDRAAFDYGYVFAQEPKLFSKRLSTEFELQNVSLIESGYDPTIDDDKRELLDSIKNGTFDEQKNIPKSKVDRLSQSDILNMAKLFLEILYRSDDGIRASIGGAANLNYRAVAMDCLKGIFEASLGRSLNDGENAVFENAIRILFHVFQGRTFREIVGIRYSYISGRDENGDGFSKFSQPAEKLPNKKLKLYGMVSEKTLGDDVSYDAVVFDSYDYLDQVISFSLSDFFIAAFKIYFEKSGDDRAKNVINLFRYGTNNGDHILLMRYGFSSEYVADIYQYIDHISENNISFKKSIANAPKTIIDMVEWYLP